MLREHLWDYAEHVVGFPIRPGQDVLVDVECTGTDKNRVAHKIEAGARGRVSAMKMMSYPDQLTISIKIPVEGHDGAYLREVFCEADAKPQFPLRPIEKPKAEAAQAPDPIADDQPTEAEMQADTPRDFTDPPLDANPTPDGYEEWHGRHYGDC